MADEFKLNDFQKKKILHVFRLLYDTNRDGVIKRDDFEMATKKTCTLLSWPENSDKYRKAEKILNKIWEGLKKYADENQDDKVSEEEWLKMWTDCVRDMEKGKTFPEWQQDFIDFMFTVNDTSGDGEIDENEYTTVYVAYGLTRENCHNAFDKISGGKNITKVEFEKLWKDYFISTDECKGNYLFGETDFLPKL